MLTRLHLQELTINGNLESMCEGFHRSYKSFAITPELNTIYVPQGNSELALLNSTLYFYVHYSQLNDISEIEDVLRTTRSLTYRRDLSSAEFAVAEKGLQFN